MEMTKATTCSEQLLEEAKRVGRHRTIKATLNAALKEYIERRRRMGIVNLFGKIDYDSSYDYKDERRKRRV